MRLLLFIAALNCLIPFWVAAQNLDCGLNSKARELVNIIQNSALQHREELQCHPLLAKAAAIKAEKMANAKMVEHVIDFQSPNQLVRDLGFPLPVLYHPVGNQIEAISGGMETASQTFNHFMSSPDHKAHLLGENDFYLSQNYIGVGYYYDFYTPHEHYWVVLISAKGK